MFLHAAHPTAKCEMFRHGCGTKEARYALIGDLLGLVRRRLAGRERPEADDTEVVPPKVVLRVLRGGQVAPPEITSRPGGTSSVWSVAVGADEPNPRRTTQPSEARQLVRKNNPKGGRRPAKVVPPKVVRCNPLRLVRGEPENGKEGRLPDSD